MVDANDVQASRVHAGISGASSLTLETVNVWGVDCESIITVLVNGQASSDYECKGSVLEVSLEAAHVALDDTLTVWWS